MERSRISKVVFIMTFILSLSLIQSNETPDEIFYNYMLQNQEHFFHLIDCELKGDNQGLYIQSNLKAINTKIAILNFEESINLGKFYSEIRVIFPL